MVRRTEIYKSVRYILQYDCRQWTCLHPLVTSRESPTEPDSPDIETVL